MPLYEYRCEQCHETLEVLQRLGAEAPSECPHCGGALVKVISAPALQFKGSGWYVTDYGKGNGGRPGTDGGNGAGKEHESKTETAEKPPTPAAGTTTAESKPASSSPAAPTRKPD